MATKKKPTKPKVVTEDVYAMHAVASSNIAEIGYDANAQMLSVRFKSEHGAVYDYIPVPLAVYQEFDVALSKGNYFATSIKPHYFCKKRVAQVAVPEQKKVSTKAGELEAILTQTRAATVAEEVFPYCLWVLCGREQTEGIKGKAGSRYGRCLDLIQEAGGAIGVENIDAAIALARERNL